MPSLHFIKAGYDCLDEPASLYDAVCGYLEAHINYPHWESGIYPARETAEAAIAESTQYVCLVDGRVAGAVRLSPIPEAGFAGVRWKTPDDYERILVVYTLCVHPDFLRKGVARFMLEEAEKLAKEQGCISLRLDIVKGNVPVERLYRNAGYEYITTKSLGYEEYGIPWFDLFEKIL